MEDSGWRIVMKGCRKQKGSHKAPFLFLYVDFLDSGYSPSAVRHSLLSYVNSNA